MRWGSGRLPEPIRRQVGVVPSRPRGQHIELGIAESNLFLLLAALGLSIDTEAILAAARDCLVVMQPNG